LWLGLSCGDHSPITTTTPCLKPLIPSDSLLRFQSIPVRQSYPKCFFFPTVGGKTITSARCCHISGSSYATSASRFFRLEGSRTLDKVKSLTVRNSRADLAICFAISSPVDFLMILVNSPLLHSCCLRPQYLMPLLRSGFG
jgi:hypothetical protein